MFIVSLIVSVSAAAAEFFIEGKATEVFYIYAFAVPILVLLFPFAFYATRGFKGAVSKERLFYLNQYILIFIVLNIPGSLFFHKAGIQYDRFIHIIVGFFAFPFILLLLLPFYKEFKTEAIKKSLILLIVFTVSLAGLFLWEGFQYLTDQLMGTKLFFDASQNIRVDFWEDIFFGFFGLVAGLIYSHYSFNRFLRF